MFNIVLLLYDVYDLRSNHAISGGDLIFVGQFIESHEPCDAAELIQNFAESGAKQKRRAPNVFIGTEITRQVSAVDSKYAHIGSSQYSMYVIFNIGCYGWHYGWRGGRFKQNVRHAFSISIVHRNGGSCKVLGEFRSSEFRVISVRTATPGSNECVGSDDSCKGDCTTEDKDMEISNIPGEQNSSTACSTEIEVSNDFRSACSVSSSTNFFDDCLEKRYSERSDAEIRDYKMLAWRHGCSADLTLKRKKRKRNSRDSKSDVAPKKPPQSQPVSLKLLNKAAVAVPEVPAITPELCARSTPLSMSMDPGTSAEKRPIARLNAGAPPATANGWRAKPPAFKFSSSVASELRQSTRLDSLANLTAPLSPPHSPTNDNNELPQDVIEFLRTACSSPIFRHSGSHSNLLQSRDPLASAVQDGHNGGKYVSNSIRGGAYYETDSTSCMTTSCDTLTSTSATSMEEDHEAEDEVAKYFTTLTAYQI